MNPILALSVFLALLCIQSSFATTPRPNVPVLRDSEQRICDHAYHCFPRGERMGRAIRTERPRLVEWKVPRAEASTADLELYDYQNDPAETKNLAAAEPQIVARHTEAKPPQTNKPKVKPPR